MLPKEKLPQIFEYLKQFLTEERLRKIEHFSELLFLLYFSSDRAEIAALMMIIKFYFSK